MSLEKIIIENIEIDNDNCWIWKRSRRAGYGWIDFKGHKCYAHRFSVRVFKGEFDNSLSVLHECDKPLCCNPNHLFLGTQTDNMRDMVKKGRSTNAKLTERQVLEIYHLSDSCTIKELKSRFNVSDSQIRRILNGNKWKHLYHLRLSSRGSLINSSAPDGGRQ